VIKYGTKENPNSNNDLTLWVWTPNRKRYIAWFNKQKEAESAPKQPSRPAQANATTDLSIVGPRSYFI
jgi:hypothetical protein